MNRPADVTIIQDLLNKVPLMSGGPSVKLQVDGKCGPKTVEAIRKFQIRHFGAGSADGRVDPNGRTLAKLNDFDDDALDFPTLTTSSTLRCPHGGTVSASLSKAPAYGQTPRGVELSTADQFPIAGCNFPSPCVRVRWISSPALVLDTRRVGLCVNSAGIPQGPVVIVKT